MAKQTTIDEQANTPAQGAEGAAETPATVDEPRGTLLEAKDPEWVAELLASNLATQESNQAVIDAIANFRESANELIEKIGEKADPEVKEAAAQVAQSVFNADENYVVAEGKSFRDPKDFTKEYTAGDDVSHLDTSVLERLLNQGLIVAA